MAEVVARRPTSAEVTELFAAYGGQRISQWQQLLGLTGGLQPREQTDPWVCQLAPRLLPCLPAAGAELSRFAEQVGLDIDQVSGPV